MPIEIYGDLLSDSVGCVWVLRGELVPSIETVEDTKKRDRRVESLQETKRKIKNVVLVC